MSKAQATAETYLWPHPTESLLNKRRELCSEEVTLDGQPAKIMGAALNYALVRTLDNKNFLQVSWGVIERVMERDRNFRS